jgi:hypothetical protein
MFKKDRTADIYLQILSCCCRPLVVFELIWKKCQIAIYQLLIEAEIPRVSVWRSVENLESSGRIRRHHGAFEAIHHIDSMRLKAHISLEETYHAIQIIDTFEAPGVIDFHVENLRHSGLVSFIDVSKRLSEFNSVLSMVHDVLTSACLLANARTKTK